MTNKQSWEDKDTEMFMDCCDLFKDYFKRAEIEMSDHTIGHLAVITRDYVSSILTSKSEQMEREKVFKEDYNREDRIHERNVGFNAGISACQEILKK